MNNFYFPIDDETLTITNDFSFPMDDDDETLIILNAMVWCLEKYFQHSKQSAIKAVDDYYTKNKDRFHNSDWGDDIYHYEGAYKMALRIHYSQDLQLGIDVGTDFINWMKNQENIDISRLASIYTNKLYEVMRKKL
jgi:hypothetical protein